MKINICIPVFNEENNLPDVIKNLDDFLSTASYKDLQLNVVFYDDGSTDNSLSILKNSKFEVLFGLNNKGLGNAISTLFKHSLENDVDGVIKLDGDGQMDISDIDLFLDRLMSKPTDLIQGNRFYRSHSFTPGYLKRFGMLFFRIIFRIIGLKIKDTSNGFIYVSKKWLEDFKIIGNYNAAQQIILDTKLRDLTYSEVDVNIKNREAGKSFIGIKYPFNVLSSMFLLLLYRKTVKFLIIPGLVFLLFAFLFFVNDVSLWIRQLEQKVISNEITILTFFLGVQFVSLGSIIELLKKQKII